MKIKNLFATPKKAIVTSVCLVGGLGVLAAGSVAVTGSVARNNAIGNIAAEDIALKDAGIAYSDARIRRTEFDFDNGQYVYEIEFSSGGVEYDYTIKASDGTILWRDSELMDGYVANADQGQPQTPPAANTQQPTQNQQEQTQQQPAQEQQPQNTESQQQEQTQNQPQTPPATNTQQQEQQPQTQQQPAQEQQPQTQQQPPAAPQANTSNTAYISVDEAKNIALGQAGLSASDVNFVKTKLENDDGRAEYEIEFYSGTTEYDYTIDAVTGTVLEYDMDSIYD